MRNLQELNEASVDQAYAALLQCCGSTTWAHRMVAERPFANVDEILSTADRLWGALDADDWLEAFAAHPRIGQKEADTESSGSSRWAEEEQAGARFASQETQTALIKANQEYERKFGYIFIVCATGKSAEGMLKLLNERMTHGSYTELRVAADEQRQITSIRLHKLLSD